MRPGLCPTKILLESHFLELFDRPGIVLLEIEEWLRVVWVRYGVTPDPDVLATMSMTQSQLPASEAALIKSVCGGEREAFYELIRPYERMIYATAISVVKNPADAEEVAQEAVLKAYASLARFRAESKFSTWMWGIQAARSYAIARGHLSP